MDILLERSILKENKSLYEDIACCMLCMEENSTCVSEMYFLSSWKPCQTVFSVSLLLGMLVDSFQPIRCEQKSCVQLWLILFRDEVLLLY